MARSSRTPYAVLGILGVLQEKPLSGYDIKHILQNTISYFWSESYGQIYPVLRRLTAEKLIRPHAPAGTGRKKTVYSLTAAGKKRLVAWMRLPPEVGPHRDELILKLFFGSMTDPHVLIAHLSGHRQRAQAMLEQLSGWITLVQSEEKQAYTPYQLITLRGGVAMCRALVEWTEESVSTLNKMVKP